MVTPNTLDTMIKYTLISSILNRICKMTTKSLEYPRDPTLLDPLKNLLKLKHGEQNGNNKLTKQLNGWHGDG